MHAVFVLELTLPPDQQFQRCGVRQRTTKLIINVTASISPVCVVMREVEIEEEQEDDDEEVGQCDVQSFDPQWSSTKLQSLTCKFTTKSNNALCI